MINRSFYGFQHILNLYYLTRRQKLISSKPYFDFLRIKKEKTGSKKLNNAWRISYKQEIYKMFNEPIILKIVKDFEINSNLIKRLHS